MHMLPGCWCKVNAYEGIQEHGVLELHSGGYMQAEVRTLVFVFVCTTHCDTSKVTSNMHGIQLQCYSYYTVCVWCVYV